MNLYSRIFITYLTIQCHFQFVSIYAAYLYDSVKLYARALDQIIREETRNEPLTEAKLRSIATNGTRIVAKMIQSSPYKSKFQDHTLQNDSYLTVLKDYTIVLYCSRYNWYVYSFGRAGGLRR